MGALTIIFLIFAFLGLVLFGLWFNYYLKTRLLNYSFPVTIKEIKIEKQIDIDYLYVDLELKNQSGGTMLVKEIHQHHMKGPYDLFILRDPSGRTKKSFYEPRELFNKPLRIKNGESILKNYRMRILPQMKGKKLYFRYQVIAEGGKFFSSKGEWFQLS
jgi:hypothetical protein